MKPKIGIMGSAIEKGTGNHNITPSAMKLAYEVGREIARHNCILVNGACKGVPDESARGAKDHDGFVIGISPAGNMKEHCIRYKFPTKNYDVLIFTGFGFKGRNVVNVTNCDAVIIIAGRVGTLNEFTIAYDEGQIIGVMAGSGGIADHIRQLIKIMNKKTGATVIFDKNPHTLIKRLLVAINRKNNLPVIS